MNLHPQLGRDGIAKLSKWERGEITPRGPARRPLLMIKAHGADALLKTG